VDLGRSISVRTYRFVRYQNWQLHWGTDCFLVSLFSFSLIAFFLVSESVGDPSRLSGSESSLKFSPFSKIFLFTGILALYPLVACEKHLSSHPGVKSSANPSQSTFVQPARIFDSRTVIHYHPVNLFLKFFGLGLVIF
jgi:hypothetical protein